VPGADGDVDALAEVEGAKLLEAFGALERRLWQRGEAAKANRRVAVDAEVGERRDLARVPGMGDERAREIEGAAVLAENHLHHARIGGLVARERTRGRGHLRAAAQELGHGGDGPRIHERLVALDVDVAVGTNLLRGRGDALGSVAALPRRHHRAEASPRNRRGDALVVGRDAEVVDPGDQRGPLADADDQGGAAEVLERLPGEALRAVPGGNQNREAHDPFYFADRAPATWYDERSMRDVDPEILAEIRHAALELRTTDPQAAVRVLRRAAAAGGGAEVLARGALGEIYLEELSDLDGAEHEYRRVLDLAPGLAAAELGLARVLRETGAQSEAQAHYRAAVASLEKDVASFRDGAAAGQPIPPGAEEVVLTLLEAAVEWEERGLLASPVAERPQARSIGDARIDGSLLDWAVRERLFDALSGEEGDPAEDWFRFHSLRARLLWLQGRREDSAQAYAVAVAILQQAITAAEARLLDASTSPEERARMEEEIRGYREALSESSGGLVSLRSPRA